MPLGGAAGQDFDSSGGDSLQAAGAAYVFEVCNYTIGTDIQTTCNPTYTWIDGNTYNTNNNTATYTINGGASTGCDSIVTLNLTINAPNITVNNNSQTLTSNEPNVFYQWLDCNTSFTPISGATNQTFSPANNGNYAVEITKNGCVDTSSCYFISNAGVGIIENGFGNNLFVYPNPTKGDFSINLGETYENVKITITDILGKQIQQHTYTQTQQVNSTLINNPAGIYFITVETENKKAVIKLVKK